LSNLKAAVFATLIALTGSANGITVEEADRLSDKELNNLPSEQMASLPYKYVLKRIGFDEGLAEFVIKKSLYDLNYAFWGDSVEEQLTAFRADNNLESIGEVLMSDYTLLQKLAGYTRATPIYTPHGSAEVMLYSFPGDARQATISGFWDISGEEEAFPVGYSDISCDQNEGRCEETEVYFSTHSLSEDGNRLPASQYNMGTHTNYYNILGWTDKSVVARNEAGCRSVTITLNLETKKATQIVEQTGGSCGNLDDLTEPRIAVMKPTFEIQYNYFQDLNKSLETFKSKRYLKELEELISATPR